MSLQGVFKKHKSMSLKRDMPKERDYSCKSPINETEKHETVQKTTVAWESLPFFILFLHSLNKY